MNRPRVTVLMSVYNGERFLKRAVDSILHQTFGDFVFLIINDGSTDRTGEILEGYADTRLRVVENDKNIGLTKSLNKGLKIAETEYVARMDADDVSHAERLEKQVKFLDENPDVGLLGTRYLKIDEEGREEGEIVVPIGRDNVKRMLLVKNSFCHGSVLFRKSIVERAGFYNENISISQDYDLWLRVSDLCTVENYPEVLHKWRCNKQSGISSLRFTEQGDMAWKIREKHIRRKIDDNSISFDNLKQIALANPIDRLISQITMEEFEKLRPEREDFRVHYMQLRYIHLSPRFESLNDIARHYVSQGKRSLAFMCLVESLRQYPKQPGILKLSEEIQSSTKAKLPPELCADTCTVSVIMPTYERGEEIRESIESVLNQTYEDLELIVVNDGGTDEVEKIINDFNSNQIRYCKLKENRGLSGALNEGLKVARGRYVAYLDDDDVYYRRHIETLVAFIEKYPDFDCVYSNSWWCYGENVADRFAEYYRNLSFRPGKFNRSRLYESNYISTLNILHRKRCFLKAGTFNEDLGKLMDWDLWIRFSKWFSFYQLEEVTGEYRWKQDNMSVANRLEVEFLFRIVRSYYEFFEGRVALANSYRENGNRERAREMLDEIAGEYKDSVKTASLLQEVFLLSRSLAKHVKRSFRVQVARDFFNAAPRACLKAIVASDSMLLLFVILDLFVLRAIKRMRYRTNEFIKSFLPEYNGGYRGKGVDPFGSRD